MEILIYLLLIAAIVFLVVSTWCEYKLMKMEWKEEDEDENSVD